jgi:hypothetical protein
MPYYGSVRMFRRQDDSRWTESVEQVAQELQRFAGEREAA